MKTDMKFDREAEPLRKKKSLKYSIFDGAWYSSMVGFGESFFSAFALFLKATNTQLAMLSSIPQVLGAASQLLSEKLIHVFKTRKRFVTTVAFLQALMYLPILLAFLYGDLKVYFLILFVCLYWIFGSIGSAAWSSWMGDLVDSKERGAYFGKRNKIASMISFITYLLAGFLLQRYGAGGREEAIGFIIIFAIALLSRVISFSYLMRKYEPYYVESKEGKMNFVQFIQHAKDDNFGLFVIFMCVMNFAVYLGAPFFTAYMLNDLKLDYMTFAIINGSAIIIKFVSMPIWGKMCDKYGSLKIMTLTGYLMPLVPITWLFGHSLWYLILIQFYSGFVWAGFELSTFNFMFDTTHPAKRAAYISYFNVLMGIALFLGAMAGSVIVKYNNVFWSAFLFIFLISGIARFIATLIFIRKLKETRQVEEISYENLLFRVVSMLPAQGAVHNVITFHVEEEKDPDREKTLKIKIKFFEGT